MELIEKVVPLLSDPEFVSLLLVLFGFLFGWASCLFCHFLSSVLDFLIDVMDKFIYSHAPGSQE